MNTGIENKVFVIAATVTFGTLLSAQGPSDEELARLLAHDGTRERAIVALEASKGTKIQLLLSWARNPPPQVDKRELYIGLADAFGRLRTKEAIPFLVRNISMERTRLTRPNIWLKTEAVIVNQLPAAGALIRIGPDASKALVAIPWESHSDSDRLIAIFTVAQIGDPEARGFLVTTLGRANTERNWAQRGLDLLDKPSN